MATTPEGRTKVAIDEALDNAKAYNHKPVQNGMGAPALDYHVCHKGFYAAVEAKAERTSPVSVRQVRTMIEAHEAGGSVFLIPGSDSDDMAQLIGWLMNPVPGFVSVTARSYLVSNNIAEAILKD